MRFNKKEKIASLIHIFLQNEEVLQAHKYTEKIIHEMNNDPSSTSRGIKYLNLKIHDKNWIVSCKALILVHTLLNSDALVMDKLYRGIGEFDHTICRNYNSKQAITDMKMILDYFHHMESRRKYYIEFGSEIRLLDQAALISRYEANPEVIQKYFESAVDQFSILEKQFEPRIIFHHKIDYQIFLLKFNDMMQLYRCIWLIIPLVMDKFDNYTMNILEGFYDNFEKFYLCMDHFQAVCDGVYELRMFPQFAEMKPLSELLIKKVIKKLKRLGSNKIFSKLISSNSIQKSTYCYIVSSDSNTVNNYQHAEVPAYSKTYQTTTNYLSPSHSPLYSSVNTQNLKCNSSSSDYQPTINRSESNILFNQSEVKKIMEEQKNLIKTKSMDMLNFDQNDNMNINLGVNQNRNFESNSNLFDADPEKFFFNQSLKSINNHQNNPTTIHITDDPFTTLKQNIINDPFNENPFKQQDSSPFSTKSSRDQFLNENPFWNDSNI